MPSMLSCFSAEKAARSRMHLARSLARMKASSVLQFLASFPGSPNQGWVWVVFWRVPPSVHAAARHPSVLTVATDPYLADGSAGPLPQRG